LPQPIEVTRFNPFTGETITVISDQPNWDDDAEFEDAAEPGEEDVASQLSGPFDYGQYLEERAPQFIRSRPHWCTKGVMSDKVESLIKLAEGVDQFAMRSPLYSPPQASATIHEIPDRFVEQLKQADQAWIKAIAPQWLEAFCENIALEDIVTILHELIHLAKLHVTGQHMYLMMEC
jgi:hypothetical protein